MYLSVVFCLLLLRSYETVGDVIVPGQRFVFPAFGDIALSDQKPVLYPDDNKTFSTDCTRGSSECSGRVWIYFGDGIRLADWGTISAHQTTDVAKTVICRQLGYSKPTELTLEDTIDSNINVWFTSLDCSHFKDIQNHGDWPQHVFNKHCLRNNSLCKLGDPRDECNSHKNDLGLTCSVDRYTDNDQVYSGQARICPPDQHIPGFQASFGLMEIYYSADHHAADGHWGAICVPQSKNIDLDSFKPVMNTFCRSLGYTQSGPGGVYTTNALKTEKFNFTKCSDAEKKVWLELDDIYECSFSTSCFGCCYNRPPDGGSPNCENLDPDENYIVISCVFDPFNEAHVEGGNQSFCDLDTGHLDSVCNLDEGVRSREKKVEEAFLGISVVLFFILLVANICCIIYKVYKRYKKKDPERRPFVTQGENHARDQTPLRGINENKDPPGGDEQ